MTKKTTDKAKDKKLTTNVAETELTEKYLTFFVEDQLYAIPSSQVMEIIRMQPITPMPKMPAYVKGVINLRGKIVPMVDLQLKFDRPAFTYNDRTSIVVVQSASYTAGLIVPAVNDVTNIAKSQINESPAVTKDGSQRYVKSIATLGDDVALILDLAPVLGDLAAGQQTGDEEN